jgi:bifunctional DNA-binding transcriptional regulator/antitoxin component of YhaV-PrlF toxin-antitoxin module
MRPRPPLRKLFPLGLLLFTTLACNFVSRLSREIEKAGQPTVLTSPDGRFQLTIPGGWRKDTELNEKAEISASNRAREMYVVVLSESKRDFASDMTLEKFTELSRNAMMGNVRGAQATAPTPTSVSGHPAMQYELRGTVENVNIAYLNTTVETPGDYHQIIAWTLPSRFNDNQATLREVTQSFKESALAPPGKPAPSVPPGAKTKR